MTQHISITNFETVFLGLSDQDCLSYFRFTKAEISQLSNRLCSTLWSTRRNQYRTTPLLSFCVLLRRRTTPFGWRDVEMFFGKHTSQVSEIFWEAAEHIMHHNEPLVTSSLKEEYMQRHAHIYAMAVQQKTGALENCVAFIDGTNLFIARPSSSGQQNVVYNGHKRQHSLRYQALMTRNGMFLHLFGPVEGRRHDWTLYSRSNLDEMLAECLLMNNTQYCIYGDSGYKEREYLRTPFKDLNCHQITLPLMLQCPPEESLSNGCSKNRNFTGRAWISKGS